MIDLKIDELVDDFFGMVDKVQRKPFTRIEIIPVREKTFEEELKEKLEGCCCCGDDCYELPLSDLIRKVIFVNPKTIVIWNDGSKTIVTAQGEKFDKEKGVLMAYYKRFFGGNYMNDLTYVIENAEEIKKIRKGAARRGKSKKD